MRPHPLTVVLVLAATAGFTFAAFSTYDFVAHLDRQVHGVHCSFLPGLTTGDAGAATGCHVTLMSPYSSVLRESIWGGVPISLPAMSVFAFLIFWGFWLALRDRGNDVRATGFALLATSLPLLASLVMGYLALRELEAACKLCIGIYLASAVAFAAALGLFLRARRAQPSQQASNSPPMSLAALSASFALGVVFVAWPLVVYAVSAPDFSHYVGSCGELAYPHDPEHVTVPLGPQRAELEMIEVLDPLCPSCRALEERLGELPAAQEVSRRALLFPLDSGCNWMVDEAIHPGACTISEAVLCAGSDAQKVLDWAYAEQDAIVEASRADAAAAERMVERAFPELAACVGRPATRAKLNLALRWAVRNQLPILTPQIYVRGLRLCDEDTDLGLDYALPRLIARAKALPLPGPPPEQERPPLVPPKAARAARRAPANAPAASGESDASSAAATARAPSPAPTEQAVADAPKESDAPLGLPPPAPDEPEAQQAQPGEGAAPPDPARSAEAEATGEQGHDEDQP